MSDDKPKVISVYEGEAKIGEIMKGLTAIQLRPEDFSSPVSLQMAFSRIYEGVMKAMQEGPKKKYIAEVRFHDAMGQLVVIAVDLGESPPPFSSNKVKARIAIELYEEE